MWHSRRTKPSCLSYPSETRKAWSTTTIPHHRQPSQLPWPLLHHFLSFSTPARPSEISTSILRDRATRDGIKDLLPRILTRLYIQSESISSPLRSAQDATTGERVHLRLSRSAGWSVFFPAWARSCSSPAQSLEPLLMTLLITLAWRFLLILRREGARCPYK